MAKKNYLGPGQSASMKLRRAYLDLSDELRQCRPLGPEYERLEALLLQIDVTHLALFRKPVREDLQMHVCGVMQVERKTPPP